MEIKFLSFFWVMTGDKFGVVMDLWLGESWLNGENDWKICGWDWMYFEGKFMKLLVILDSV
jgi:hypothetical protein